MSRHDVITTDAIILRIYPLGEADRLVVVLTESNGKLRGVAPAARRSQRRFGGGLAPGSRGRLVVAPGPERGLARLQEFHVTRGSMGTSGHPTHFAVWGIWLTIVEVMSMEQQVVPERLALVDHLLIHLDTTPPVPLLMHSLLHWLRHTGFLPSMTRCGHCDRPIAPDATVPFVPTAGGTICPACRVAHGWSLPVTPAMRQAWLALEHDIGPATLATHWQPENEAVFRAGLWQTILSVIDRPLPCAAYWPMLWPIPETPA